jgi:hypothetical protein
MLRSLSLRGALLPLVAASYLVLSAAAAQATMTVASHADPSGSAADPVFTLFFSNTGVIVNAAVVRDLVLTGAYSEDASDPAPDAPLELILGVEFASWDFEFEDTFYAPVAHFGGFSTYVSGSGSFAYYLLGSDHSNPANLIFGASFDTSTLTIPASGLGSLDFSGASVDLEYGPASGLAGVGLSDPEQFGFSFASYVGNPGTVLGPPNTATATASFTSSATVEVAEPACAGLVAAGLLTGARRRARS